MKTEDLVILDKNIKEKISKYEHKRFLFDMISIQRPFKLILGLRGVGKTTLLVQKAIEDKGFYINLDNLALKSVNLLEILKDIELKFGYSNFFLDEIQSLENWELQLKNIFEVSEYNICISGSSLINILEKSVDLSRRIITFEIPPLSFREYLLFKKNIKIDTITFDDILNNQTRNKKLLEIEKYFNLFNEYLTLGAYPFAYSKEDSMKVFENILNKTLYVDFARIKNINEESLQICLKILKYISSGSDEISFNALSNTLGISKSKIESLFSLLEKSMLIIRIEPKGIGKNLLKIHPKYSMLLPIRVFVNNLFGYETQIGNLREDMFITSMFFNRNKVFFLKSRNQTPDFYYDKKVFEIGGKSKTNKQIRGIKEAYIVKDSISYEENEIALILFGCLY